METLKISKIANKKVCVKTCESSGRGIYAMQKISPGDLIIQDTPYAAVVDDANISVACSGCFSKGGRLLCCSSCNVIHYCSEECQRKDRPYHQHECKSFVKHKRTPPASIRLICRILMHRMNDLASFKGIEDLQSNRIMFKQEQIETFAQMCMVVRECISQDALLSASEMLDLFCRMTENSFSILDEEMIAFGVGIYPNVSLLNHSCRPNCVVIFEKSKLMVRCIEPINNDQELVINYVDLSLPVEERRKELQKQYFFWCHCDSCELFKSKDNIDPRSALRCQNYKCSNAIEPPSSLDLGIEEYTSTCKICSHNIHYDVVDVEKRISKSLQLYEKGTNLRDQDNLQAMTYFKQAFEIQNKLLHMANYNLVSTHKALFDIYCNLKNWPEALSHSLALIDSYRILYSRTHPLLGIQIYTTARIYMSMDNVDICKVVELLREALKILEISYGFKHPFTKMVEMNLWDAHGELNSKKC
ncbi:21207_t:CDS:10 [Cetraspora pellucida]|uniref:21207_t:CDS:1 n=1 Tax=Cetraspora pellucida TaxID=1433469 RepID=A0A9N8WL80_9GLOM|nr:21207_t:CDS:10 [Cetraspora pellucida]